MSRPRRWSVAFAATLVSLTTVAHTGPAAFATTAVIARTAGVELVTQTASVARGGSFEVRLRLNEVPEDGRITVVLHGRVRSRSELAASMEGVGLRGEVYNVATPVASLPVAEDGTRGLTLPLDPAVPGGVALTTAGVYPVEISVQDAAGTALSSLVTHLLVRPDAVDQSPPLAVAVLARIDAPPALQPNGSIRLSERNVQGARALVAALAATANVPATLALRPETLEALLTSGDPETATLRDQLRTAAATRAVMPLAYVDVSPDALAAAGLTAELAQSFERGRAALEAVLGVMPRSRAWLADPSLDLPGLRALEGAGVRHVLLEPDQLRPLRAGVLSLSLAQPFLLDPDHKPLVDALALDPELTARLATATSPGLEVSRLLAELAVLWFEQPGVARAVVLPLDPSTRGSVVQGLLSAIGSGGLFHATYVDDLFDTASPLRQPGGGRVDRTLAPHDPRPIGRDVARGLLDARALVSSFAGLVGPDDPGLSSVSAHVLLATSADLTTSVRQAHLDTARTGVRAVTDSISAPSRHSITLTARDGTVPLTLQNDSGVPVNVLVRLRSSKVGFPHGDTLAVTLSDKITRLNIPIRARASGTFPLQVSVTSPDGALGLARFDVSVQSTAVSGVGLVLSLGAAVFLLVWWARHWRRTRRSEKLVTAATSADAPR